MKANRRETVAQYFSLQSQKQNKNKNTYCVQKFSLQNKKKIKYVESNSFLFYVEVANR